MAGKIAVDNQPISATFFGETKYLTDFITPDALEVKELYTDITKGLTDIRQRILACCEWVGQKVRYVRYVKGELRVNGRLSVQGDFWQNPSLVLRTRVGNCANKSFLLCSLIRNDLSAADAHVVLGNLMNNGVGGHAWCIAQVGGEDYLLEATKGEVALAGSAGIYDPVVIFNDQNVTVVEGKAVLEPLGYCCVQWLSDYLDERRCDNFIATR